MSDKPRKKTGAKKRTQTVVKKPKIIAPDARLRKKPNYKSFKLHKRIKRPEARLPSVGQLSKRAVRLLLANKKAMLWFVLVYGLLVLMFVRGISAPVDVEAVRSELELYTGEASSFTNNVTILSVLINSSLAASGDVSSMYQLIFILSSSLALIWLFRQQQAGENVTMKDAFYRGMYPIVPFVLVCIMILVQLIPAMIGNAIYGTVVQSGLAVSFAEQFSWFLFFLFSLLLSLHMIAPSIMALFVVTLPEMTPRRALKEAKNLVVHRRVPVLLRVLALFVVIGLLFVGVLFPVIFVSATLAQILFFVLSIAVLPYAVSYLFVLYRELL